jgi:hypothetical protein
MPAVHTHLSLTRLLLLVPALSLVLLTSGCVFDVHKAMQEWAEPSASFEQPPAWTCTEIAELPMKNGLQDCTRCRNSTQTPQAVTVDKQRLGVTPGQSVYLCQSSVVVKGHIH